MRNVRVVAALMLTLFALCSCSLRPVKPEVQIVKVPVAVKCIESAPVKPVFEVSLLRSDDDLDKAAKSYMIERHQRIAYEAELEALVSGCVKN